MTTLSILIPFDPAECTTVALAARRSGVHVQTIRNWCRDYGIGRQIAAGRFLISKPALEMHLTGDHAALAKYHTGDRQDASVVKYFVQTGVKLQNLQTKQNTQKA